MIFELFRRKRGNRRIVERLYGAIAAVARDPVFYRDLGVPDKFEGRFDMLTLTATLALARLRELPTPADDLAQDLADLIFREFDLALRETGVGDVIVPKRMKILASAFFGRAHAYAAALEEGSESLESVLRRNIFAGADQREAAARLARWAHASKVALSRADLADFEAGHPPFADRAILFEGEPCHG